MSFLLELQNVERLATAFKFSRLLAGLLKYINAMVHRALT